jgi:hypothetical protein
MRELWAITSYFNPAGYARRLINYRIFRERLAVPLVTVELAYRPEFELCEADADALIQIRDADVMWQKERLLNIALKALPESCRQVAWLDSDIVFARDDWMEEAGERLDDVPLLQLFNRVCYLPQEGLGGDFAASDAYQVRSSIAFTTASGTPAGVWSTDRRDRRHPPGVGLAWAARRDVLDRHGFYDACIMGGGDRALVSAAEGSFAELMDGQHMNDAQRRRYLAWAEPFQADVNGVDRYLGGDLFHLWHGGLKQRAYVNRHAGLARFDFDPFSDIVVAENGAWRWNSDKPEMHSYVRDYFGARSEDN